MEYARTHKSALNPPVSLIHLVPHFILSHLLAFSLRPLSFCPLSPPYPYHPVPRHPQLKTAEEQGDRLLVAYEAAKAEYECERTRFHQMMGAETKAAVRDLAEHELKAIKKTGNAWNALALRAEQYK